MSKPTDKSEVRQQALDRYAQSFNDSDILSIFDTQLSFPDTDTVRALIEEPSAPLKGGMGETQVFNGGVLAAMYDLVIGAAAALVDPTCRAATVQLSMNFERPVVGDVLRAEASVDRAGSKLVFASAQIFDGRDRLCSHGQGVVRLSNTPWTGDSPGG